MTLVPGTRLGRYEIRSKIGEGGMGEVYLAQDTKLDRKVAVKILSTELAGNQDRMRRFTQEAKTASALNHPNILTIYEIDDTSSGHFIATEFIEGLTLREQMRNAPMKLAEVLEVATQIASALAAAHEARIIHRDIKPENVMLRRDGIVKVLDFGLAKLTEPSAGSASVDAEAPTRAAIKTGPGVVLGTPQYMSPEQARGLDLDARSDIWSLGVVLYEMVAGRLPFQGETKSHTVVSILETEPPPLTTFTRATSAELQRIVRKALTKDRDSRYQTARDLMIDLKNLRRDLDLQSELERSSAPSRQQNVSSNADVETQLHAAATHAETPQPVQTATTSGVFISHARVVIIGVVLLLLVVIVLGYWFWDRRAGSIQAIDSIAVLPFVNQNNDSDSEYLSDGLTESIINSLAQLPNLKVIARSSVFRYKGQNKDPLTIGKELGVRAVLTGRIMQRGDNVVISAELLEVRDNRQLWGEQYSKKVSDLLSVQRDIAREITGALRLTISGEDQSRVAKHYTEDAEAYRLYLQGRFYWNKRTEESYRKAIDYFRQAIDKDPNYALAYTGLADCYSFLSSQGIRLPQDVFPLAKDAATKALQIDPALSEAHTSLAYVKLYYDWEWAEAEQEYKKAIELNPNYGAPHHGYAYLLISSGRTEEAFSEIKKAEAIDPLSVLFQTDHGEYYYFTRRPDEAIAQLQKAIEMDPSFVRAHFLLGRALIQKGRCDEGIDEAIKAEKMGPVGEQLGWLAQEYAACSRKAEAQQVMNQLLEISKNHYVSPHWFAATQAGLGNKDEAFKWLEQSIDRRFGPMIYLRVNPIWDPLRSDPRFAVALQRVGLTR
jgi:serine/threonine protein kinase/tetratricopeptide (TPR) repeat protein